MAYLRRKKLIVVAITALLVSVVSTVAQDTVSVASDTRWHRNAVDNAYMNREIANAAERYKQYAPIPRIAFYDIGYPKDKTEFGALNGHAILLLSALSQDGSELPIKRVYVRAGGQEHELQEIKKIFVKNPDLNGQTVKTFGQYRVDSLFLFPVHLRFQAGELYVDFAKNRSGMKVAAFDGTVPDGLKLLPTSKPVAGKTNSEVIRAFLQREYPGYVDK